MNQMGRNAVQEEDSIAPQTGAVRERSLEGGRIKIMGIPTSLGH